MIRWTQNTEALQLPAEPSQVLEAQAALVDADILLDDLREAARRHSAAIEAATQKVLLRKQNALARLRSKMVSRLGLVGYDLEAGEVVLADPESKAELLRRPMNEAERLIARQMPFIGEP